MNAAYRGPFDWSFLTCCFSYVSCKAHSRVEQTYFSPLCCLQFKCGKTGMTTYLSLYLKDALLLISSWKLHLPLQLCLLFVIVKYFYILFLLFFFSVLMVGTAQAVHCTNMDSESSSGPFNISVTCLYNLLLMVLDILGEFLIQASNIPLRLYNFFFFLR